ncbi:MAG: tol-pal system-associated acyl-CoA thioesterase [Alphaproteobacteria bacterium RIFCSPHIGHO2_12_FULL_45_9]|nr:MAG: tol-pal system-associated acyl-CoA thioesterase [Alphaproteobacteria bacterium RIFCSPHIGHO2_02_FULL_46_13]OFW99547.1 MAG: tol-pal system-associated acyl-CoA thioesterase [Alphaproteobacteria bacterium RIFCSPHIGHO2_12_FULL_45_9]
MTHDFPVRVYYDDTDAGGVVYHANYLKFAERARTEYLRSLGFENTQIRDEHGIIIVVKSLEAEYLSPSRLDDFLIVQTRLLSVKNTSFVMEQKTIRDGACVFSMNIVLVCVNEAGRPSKIPDAVKNSFLNEGL